METPAGVEGAPEANLTAHRAAPLDARQRWRLTFCRELSAGDQGLVGRDYAAAWEEALGRSGLPIAETAAGRLRFSLGAPLPASVTGEAELAELWLTERCPAWQVRETLTPRLPGGHRITDLEDLWLAAPALAGRVAAADYRVTLAHAPDGPAVSAACGRLLDSRSLPRTRVKGGVAKEYDLRPLLISLTVADPGAGVGTDSRVESVVVRMRTRVHPELGSGRPEEVLAALADELGLPLQAAQTTRERLLLTDELDR